MTDDGAISFDGSQSSGDAGGALGSSIDLNLSDNQGDQGGGELTPQLQAQADWQLAEGIAPETVVAIGKDGKPITAGEIHRGYMRDSDYTQKRQAEAAQLNERMQAIAEIEPYVQTIMTGSAEEIADIFEYILKQRGLEVPTDGRQRGADGRFVRQSQTQSGIDPTQFAEGSNERMLAEALIAQEQRSAALQTQVDRFLDGLQSQFDEQQAYDALGTIAQEWAGKGLKEANVDTAMQLVGKQITARQAMMLANLELLVRHNAQYLSAEGSTPGDPRSMDMRGRASLQGRSLHDANVF